jgi:GNAT superfamily N-acetyltransferase
MTKDEVIIRTYEDADRSQLYTLLSDGLKGVMDDGTINSKTISLAFNEFIDKLGLIKFLITNTIFFNLILIIFRTNLSISSFLFSSLFFFTFWGIILFKNIKTSHQFNLNYASKAIQTDYKEPLSWIQEGVSHLWVACLSSDRNKVVASLGIIQNQDDNRIPLRIRESFNEKIVQLMRLYVNKEHRNKGIASKLIQVAENWSRDKGYKQIMLSTSGYQTEAVKLYLKRGYRIIHKFSDWRYYMWFSQIVFFLKDL